jgi:hypothetical protein
MEAIIETSNLPERVGATVALVTFPLRLPTVPS